MKIVIANLLCLLLASPLARAADECFDSNCALPKCRCSSVHTPLQGGITPQLITLTIEEAVVEDTFKNLWEPLLFHRKNPDGNPISGTFFVAHDYTNYKYVQDLYVQGFEIGVNSITNNGSSDYWKTASKNLLVQEFEGQKIILSTFANIPAEDIVGVRTPMLQFQGDISVNAFKESGFEYDSSWATRSTHPLYPYTLDYKTSQECSPEIPCPVNAHPGFWMAPIINLREMGDPSLQCNALNGCNIQGTADQIAAYLLNEVNQVRNAERAPLTLIVPSAFFRATANSYEGFEKFLDALSEMDDVFLVSLKQTIDWMKNPVPVEQFQTQVFSRSSDCLVFPCILTKVDDGYVRYMISCVNCPEVFPWLGNPLGID